MIISVYATRGKSKKKTKEKEEKKVSTLPKIVVHKQDGSIIKIYEDGRKERGTIYDKL